MSKGQEESVWDGRSRTGNCSHELRVQLSADLLSYVLSVIYVSFSLSRIFGRGTKAGERIVSNKFWDSGSLRAVTSEIGSPFYLNPSIFIKI